MILWRLLSVLSGKEYAVLAELKTRKLYGYVPSETVWRGPANRRYPASRPFLPAGYVFAQLTDSDLASVISLPDIIELIRIRGQTDDETRAWDKVIAVEIGKFATDLKAQEDAGDFDHTRKRSGKFSVGQKVKIAKGQFSGHVATFAGIREDGRADLLLSFNMGPAGPIVASLEKLEAA